MLIKSLKNPRYEFESLPGYQRSSVNLYHLPPLFVFVLMLLLLISGAQNRLIEKYSKPQRLNPSMNVICLGH